MINSFSLVSLGKFISLLLSKDSFVRYIILNWQFILLASWIYYLTPSSLQDICWESYRGPLVHDKLLFSYCFQNSLSLTFDNLSHCALLWIHPFWSLYSFLNLDVIYFPRFGEFGAIIFFLFLTEATLMYNIIEVSGVYNIKFQLLYYLWHAYH